MNDKTFDQLLNQISNLRDRNQRLSETDIVSAQHKGYSGAGQTVAEIETEIAANEAKLEKLRAKLDAASFD